MIISRQKYAVTKLLFDLLKQKIVVEVEIDSMIREALKELLYLTNRHSSLAVEPFGDAMDNIIEFGCCGRSDLRSEDGLVLRDPS